MLSLLEHTPHLHIRSEAIVFFYLKVKQENETKIGITIALTTIVELALATIALSNALAITPKLARLIRWRN